VILVRLVLTSASRSSPCSVRRHRRPFEPGVPGEPEGPANQEPGRPGAREGGNQAPTALESARLRWERFTPEQKERARARYERFLAMSDEEREQLVESARRLKERTDRVQKELEQKATSAWRSSTRPAPRPRARDVADESRAVGARIRGQLPDNLLERLENAKPEERARFFREFRVQQRTASRATRSACSGRSSASPARRSSACRRSRDRSLRERARAPEAPLGEGRPDLRLPPGITREQWDAWLELPPESFFDVLQRYRESRIGAAEKSAASRDKSPGDPDGRAASERRQALESSSPPRVRAPKTSSRSRTSLRRNVRRGSRRIVARAAPRCCATGSSSAGELEALERKSDAEFFRTVRRMLWKSGRAPWLRRLRDGFRR